jgi:TolB protein
MAIDGTGVTQLTHNPGDFDEQPVYSPDGTRIAFVSSTSHDWELHVMNADGSGEFKVPLAVGLKITPYWP